MKTPTKSKPQKYKSKYLSDWEQDKKWISKSDKGQSFAFCKLCVRHFSICHGGRNDVTRHEEAEIHKNATKSAQNVLSLNNYFKAKEDVSEVMASEVIWCQFVAEHNLSFSVSNDFNKVIKKMFPDSAIAKKFSCAKTKTTQIVKGALDVEARAEVFDKCRTHAFSIAIDESNDRTDRKFLVILARYLDMETGKAVTRLLDMPECKQGTAEAIFQTLDQSLSDKDIPWKNVVAFTSDNCSTMVGVRNSVLSRILQKNPNVYGNGCVCHMANLCAAAGVKELPLNVDELLTDIYFHFDKSTKRREAYKEFMVFTDVEYSKVLKHVGTRWLSLQKCVDRTLQHYPALKSYFNSHEDSEKAGRVRRIATTLTEPTTYMYLKFLSFILASLNEFNTTFQADDARLGYMAEEVSHLMRKYLKRFVKTRAIREAATIKAVEYANTEIHLGDDLIAIGQQTRMYIEENRDDLSTHQLQTFFGSVRAFYMATVKKMVKHFPFDEPLLQDSRFLVPDTWDDVESDSVVRLARRFPNVVSEEDIDAIVEEFGDLQVMPADLLPTYNTQDEGSQTMTRLDAFWASVLQMKNKVTQKPRFPCLARLIMCLISIPNSNADCERTFSMVRKIHTEHRSDLDTETVVALLSCKLNIDMKAHELKPSPQLLQKAKRATMDYNNRMNKKMC